MRIFRNALGEKSRNKSKSSTARGLRSLDQNRNRRFRPGDLGKRRPSSRGRLGDPGDPEHLHAGVHMDSPRRSPPLGSASGLFRAGVAHFGGGDRGGCGCGRRHDLDEAPAFADHHRKLRAARASARSKIKRGHDGSSDEGGEERRRRRRRGGQRSPRSSSSCSFGRRCRPCRSCRCPRVPRQGSDCRGAEVEERRGGKQRPSGDPVVPQPGDEERRRRQRGPRARERDTELDATRRERRQPPWQPQQRVLLGARPRPASLPGDERR